MQKSNAEERDKIWQTSLQNISLSKRCVILPDHYSFMTVSSLHVHSTCMQVFSSLYASWWLCSLPFLSFIRYCVCCEMDVLQPEQSQTVHAPQGYKLQPSLSIKIIGYI